MKTEKGEARLAKDVNLKIIDSRMCFWLLSCQEDEAVSMTQNRIHTHGNKSESSCRQKSGHKSFSSSTSLNA